ncbi:MAG: hypothetical protein Q8O67_33715 [Deltaproteobacteria bacterium]|nr:hypothetical protein [Deltaproteobacteria bacterium]
MVRVTRPTTSTVSETKLPAGESPAGRDGVPTALKATAEAQRKAYLNADGTEKLVSYDGRQMPFGSTDAAKLPAGSFASTLRELRDYRDAGNAIMTADNATLHSLTYCYGTHKPMEAWLTKVPESGKLSVNVIVTPSTHAGSDAASMKKNFDNFCKTNNYNVEVLYPDGTVTRLKFDVEGNSPPKYGNSSPAPKGVTATPSPDIEIDVAKWAGKGDIRVRGWADGSAGVGGYIEHRETILHLG